MAPKGAVLDQEAVGAGELDVDADAAGLDPDFESELDPDFESELDPDPDFESKLDPDPDLDGLASGWDLPLEPGSVLPFELDSTELLARLSFR